MCGAVNKTKLGVFVSINTKFNEINSVKDMHNFMHYIDVKVSFWGSRYVTKKDHTGYLSIDELASKILALAESLKLNYSFWEKRYGNAITERITELYEESDKLIENRNFLTRLFAMLRDVFSHIRYVWDVYGEKNIFNSVSSSAY